MICGTDRAVEQARDAGYRPERIFQSSGMILKPIFYRLDEIAKQHSDDFEVQLVVGDIKQHLVNRGTRLKAEGQATSTGGPSQPTVKLNRPMPPPIPSGGPPAPVRTREQ